MSVAPANTASVLVAVSGVLQDPSTYSVSGLTLTFSGAPPTGTGNISARYLGIPASGVTTTAYRTITEFTATAGQTTFTPPSYTVGFISVYRNGVLLGSADYTATNGTTVVLATGATAGDLITTESFLVSSVLNAIPNTTGIISLSGGLISGVLPSANLPVGSVLQVVQVVKTDTFSSATGSYVDVTGLSASITPKFATSKILVLVNMSVGAFANCLFNLLRNSTNICQSTGATVNSTTNVGYPYSYSMLTIPISFLDSPATTSSTTYKIQMYSFSGTSYINARSTDQYYGGTSSVTLMEIAA
jgi:hypothetical protein